MRVGVLGVNHKLANLTLREQLAKICQRRLALGASVHGEHYFVLLSTCNRTEIYFSSEDLADTHSYLLGMLRRDIDHNDNDDFEQKLYSYFGQDCLLHLCRVATGLDSAVIVETEIQGQVKLAYENAQQHGVLPFELHYLFQKTLAISKKVRAILPAKPGLPDVEHAVLQTGQHLFSENFSPTILFIGASEINEKILKYFKQKQIGRITLCNRTTDRTRLMAENYQIPFIEWEKLSSWVDYDWVIVGTKASTHLLKPQQSNLFTKRKLIVDLSVPRNVDPLLARNSQVTLLNIDQINRRLIVRKHYLNQILIQAEEMILHAIQQQILLFQKKKEFCYSFK